jgi:hypothetical protein
MVCDIFGSIAACVPLGGNGRLDHAREELHVLRRKYRFAFGENPNA